MINSKLITSIAVLALLTAGLGAMIFEDSSDAASSDPQISETGFIEDKTAMFYYSKFATPGFTYSDSVSKKTGEVTKNSVSGDTLTTGVGKTMQANTVYTSISKMDVNTAYTLNIAEYSSSDVLNYGISVNLNENIVKTFVYMSINDAVPYCDGVALSYTAMSDVANTAFSTDVSQIHYVFTLVADEKSVAENTLNNPADYSVISYAEIKTVEVEDNVSNIGKNYGYVSTGATQYAGAALEAPGSGYYVCIFYLTNLSASEIELIIDDGSKSYTVASSELSYGKNVTGGYGYAIIPLSTLVDAGLDENMDSVNVSLGTDGTVFATNNGSEEDDDDDDDNVKIYAIAAGAVIVIIVIAGIMFLRRSN